MFINEELNRQLHKINKLIKQAKTFNVDGELQAHFTKYICIRFSGFIENAITITFTDIAAKSCDSGVSFNYIKSQLFKIQNANSEKIRNLARAFKTSWHDILRDYMQIDNRGSSINYILKDRHNIAHGRDTTVTLRQLEQHISKALQVIVFIEQHLDKEEPE